MLATRRLTRLARRLVFPATALGGAALRTDAHLHTTFTDGRSTVPEMLRAAAQAGLTTVAFTEHVRRGITWFPDFKDAVRSARREHPGLAVLTGIEAKAIDRDGALDADPELIALADVVLGACHGYPDGEGGFMRPEALTAAEAALVEFETLWGLLDNPELDVLAHPGAMTRKHFGTFPDALLRRLVFKAARAGRVIELNGEYNDPGQLVRLLAWCQEAGVWISLGSNAHHAAEVGRISRQLGAAA